MKTKLALILISLSFAGCVNQSVQEFDPASGKTTKYRTITFLNNSAMKGLRVNHHTQKGGQDLLLGITTETNTGDTESIKAIGETMGAAFGTAAATALKATIKP